MSIKIRPKTDCAYDLVALGEVMLRLDPGDMRVKNARSFRVWEGGGEYNVARGLRRCFGQRTAILTAFADNEVGRLLEDLILQGGVDSSFIKWKSFDGVGRNCRNGLNFTERGFGVRGALGVSDRGNTAASQIRPEDFDFEDLFGKRGVRWFHTGGIFAALSDTTANTIIEALKIAKKYGTVVSYDLNYRPSLWKNFGGLEKAQEVNKKIAPYVDVMIGNEEDFSACLGFELEGADISLKKIDPAAYGSMIKKVAEAYPNFKLAANTLREVKTAGINDWSAICYYDGQIYEGIKFENLEIYDRIGGGDSFASGLIYGLLEGLSTGESLNYGIAHGALAMTSPGDTSMASLEEVRELLAGKTARVQR
ncbi:MAG TPA: sugar kinase [Clostridiales bacterium]|nr:sugar kinase [Clostridiales bacterium]